VASAGTAALRGLARTVGSRVVVSLVVWYIQLIARSTRWTVIGREGWDALAAQPEGFVCITWHGRLFMAPTLAPRLKPTVAMISNSRDGDLVAQIVGRWGVVALRGSSHDHAKRRNKGGVGLYRAAARALKDDGALVGITPDGPRGPRMRAQEGAARLALMQGAPVIAVGFSVRWGWNIRSWDRFLLPLPFGRGAIVYSTPRRAPLERSPRVMARFRLALEEDLNVVTNQADDLCARARIPAAAVGSAK
jgi:lysophospholipid acyltransferase (LPLAT)-like uncharacterized protein